MTGDIRELIELPRESAFDVFTRADGVEPYLAKLREQVKDFIGDATTKDGREEMRSLAYRLAQSASYLERRGKEVAVEAKKLPNMIDANRRLCAAEIGAMKDRVRAPLTAYEDKEKERVNGHRAKIDRMNDLVRNARGMEAGELRAEIDGLEAMPIDSASCEEFLSEYVDARSMALQAAKSALAKQIAYEAEQAELARLRVEEAARAQREREAQIAQEAEERGRLKATNEQIKRALEGHAKAAAQPAPLAVPPHHQQVSQALRRFDDETAHRRAINAAAVAALIESGDLDETTARYVVTLIAQGRVPNVSINY